MDDNKLILRVNFDHGHMTVGSDRLTVSDAQGRVLWYMDAKEAHEGIILTIPKGSPLLNFDEAPQLPGRPLGFTFENDEEVMP